MKSVISALCIFILIIILITSSYYYTKNITIKMTEMISKNEIFVAKGDTESAKNEMKKINELWIKNREILAVFVDHSEIEETDLSLSSLDAELKTLNSSGFLKESSRTELLISSIFEKQKISIPNIF